jgi:hypothetical protein
VSYNRIERYKFAIEQHVSAFDEIRLSAALRAFSAISGTNPGRKGPTNNRKGGARKQEKEDTQPRKRE